jgi:hypothetical protein
MKINDTRAEEKIVGLTFDQLQKGEAYELIGSRIRKFYMMTDENQIVNLAEGVLLSSGFASRSRFVPVNATLVIEP